MPFSNFTNTFQDYRTVPGSYRNHPTLQKQFRAEGGYVRPAEDPVTLWDIDILHREYVVPLEAMQLELNADFSEGVHQGGRRGKCTQQRQSDVCSTQLSIQWAYATQQSYASHLGYNPLNSRKPGILFLMTLPPCEVIHLGLMEYQAAWELQDQLAGQIARQERPPALLLLQHPHTYTFGRRGKAENLLWDQAKLDQRQVRVFWVDRGGDVTYHGPGQLVGYPLLPLAPGGIPMQGKDGGESRIPQADYVGYLRRLERVLIETLQHFGVPAFPIEGLTGVWVASRTQAGGAAGPPAKIAALGVKVDVHGVTRHGLALNVAPDMRYWQGIIACGLADTPVTSLAEQIEPAPTLEIVCQQLVPVFGAVFRYQMIEKMVSSP